MEKSTSNHNILEVRVALTTDEYEKLASFYLDGLGLEPYYANADSNNDPHIVSQIAHGNARARIHAGIHVNAFFFGR